MDSKFHLPKFDDEDDPDQSLSVDGLSPRSLIEESDNSEQLDASMVSPQNASARWSFSSSSDLEGHQERRPIRKRLDTGPTNFEQSYPSYQQQRPTSTWRHPQPAYQGRFEVPNQFYDPRQVMRHPPRGYYECFRQPPVYNTAQNWPWSGPRFNNPRPNAAFMGVKPRRECKFCKNNGEAMANYRSHTLRNPTDGSLVCPVLRGHVCEICGQSGDDAHTRNYCPQLKREDRLPCSIPNSLKRTRRLSNGRERN